MSYTGTINGAANQNYPSASANATYLVLSGGRVGGANGPSVNAGDVVTCLATNTGGTHAEVGSDWAITPATEATKLASDLSQTEAPDMTIDSLTLAALTMKAPRVGVATVPGGVTTVSISTLAAKSTAAILATPRVASTTTPYVSDVVDGESFVINGDPGVYSWMIVDVE